MAYDAISPIGGRRGDLQAALVAQTTAAHSGGYDRVPPLENYLLPFDGPTIEGGSPAPPDAVPLRPETSVAIMALQIRGRVEAERRRKLAEAERTVQVKRLWNGRKVPGGRTARAGE